MSFDAVCRFSVRGFMGAGIFANQSERDVRPFVLNATIIVRGTAIVLGLRLCRQESQGALQIGSQAGFDAKVFNFQPLRTPHRFQSVLLPPLASGDLGSEYLRVVKRPCKEALLLNAGVPSGPLDDWHSSSTTEPKSSPS